MFKSPTPRRIKYIYYNIWYSTNIHIHITPPGSVLPPQNNDNVRPEVQSPAVLQADGSVTIPILIRAVLPISAPICLALAFADEVGGEHHIIVYHILIVSILVCLSFLNLYILICVSFLQFLHLSISGGTSSQTDSCHSWLRSLQRRIDDGSYRPRAGLWQPAFCEGLGGGWISTYH